MTVTLRATGRVIPNFALQHLMTAVMSRRHVLRLEAEHAGAEYGGFFEEIRSYGSMCVLAAVASLETLINELFLANNTRLNSCLGDVDKHFWGDRGIERLQILKKYDRALSMLERPPFASDDAVRASTQALIDWRNYLTHYKPPWDPEAGKRRDLERDLKGRFQISPFLVSGGDFLTMQAMSGSAAAWVVSTTVNYMREFDRRASLDANKMEGFWRVGEA